MSINQIIESFKILLIVTLLILIIFLVLYLSGKQYIIDNWNKFRCNPLIIPIAGMLGKNAQKNAQQCFFKTFKYFFDFLMKPFQYIIKIIQKIIKGLFRDIDSFRTLLKPIRLFILNATQKFYDTLNNFMTTIFYSFGKTRNILGRMGSIFRLTLYTLEAVQFSIKSVWDGPIGQVSRKWPPKLGKVKKFFCLEENSYILNDRSNKTLLRNMNLGDKLYSGNDKSNKLLGILKINVKNCKLYKINETYLTGDHLVYYKNKWERVKNIIEYNKEYTGNLLCPMTEQNIFYTDLNTKLRDFDESSFLDNLILSKNLTLLNSEYTYYHNVIYDTMGIAQNSVITSDNGTKLIENFKIGDIINNEEIIGISKYLNRDNFVFIKNGLVIGGRQIVWDDSVNKWKPIYQHSHVKKIISPNSMIFYSFITNKRYLNINNLKITSFLDGVNNDTLDENDIFVKNMINFGEL